MKVHKYKNTTLKFSYSEEATKFEKKKSPNVFDITLNWEIFPKLCGLFRILEL